MEFSLNTNNNKVEPKSSRELLAYFAINRNPSNPDPLLSIPGYNDQKHFSSFSNQSTIRVDHSAQFTLEAFYYWSLSLWKDTMMKNCDEYLKEGSKLVNIFGEKCLVPKGLNIGKKNQLSSATNIFTNKFLPKDFEEISILSILNESFKSLEHEPKSYDLKKLVQHTGVDENYLRDIFNQVFYPNAYEMNTDLISNYQPVCRAFNAFHDYFMAIQKMVICLIPMQVYLRTEVFKTEFEIIVSAFQVADELIETPDQRQDFMKFIMFLLLKQCVERELFWVVGLNKSKGIQEIISDLKRRVMNNNKYYEPKNAVKIVEEKFCQIKEEIPNHPLFEKEEDQDFFLKQYCYIVGLDYKSKMLVYKGDNYYLNTRAKRIHDAEMKIAVPQFYLMRAIYHKMLDVGDGNKTYQLPTDPKKIDKGWYTPDYSPEDEDADLLKKIKSHLDEFIAEKKSPLLEKFKGPKWKLELGPKEIIRGTPLNPITNMNNSKEMPAKKASEMAEVKDEEPAQREKDTENPITNNSGTYNFEQFLECRFGLDYSWESYRKLQTEKIFIDEKLKEQDVQGAELNRREAAASAAA